MKKNICTGNNMSDADGGYDAKFLDEVPDMLKCCVCHFVLKKPVHIIECGHRFCESCFNQLKDYSLTRQIDLCCPLDRQLIDTTKVFPDKGIGRAIGDLLTKCEFADDGCVWTGELRNLQSHVDKHCSHQKVQCTNESCSIMMSRMDLDEHLKVHEIKETIPSGTDFAQMINSLTYRLTECESKLKMNDDELEQQNNEIRQCKQNLKQNENELELCKTELRQCKKQIKLNHTQTGSDIKISLKEFEDLLYHSNILSNSHPRFIWQIHNYHGIDKTKDLFSPVFYSSLNGYCCKLSAKWLGHKHCQLGVFIYFVRSNNDLHLQWPFQMKVHFECIGNNDIVTNNGIVPNISRFKESWMIPSGKAMSLGIGEPTFLCGPQLEKHIINNILTIQCYFETVN